MGAPRASRRARVCASNPVCCSCPPPDHFSLVSRVHPDVCSLPDLARRRLQQLPEIADAAKVRVGAVTCARAGARARRRVSSAPTRGAGAGALQSLCSSTRAGHTRGLSSVGARSRASAHSCLLSSSEWEQPRRGARLDAAVWLPRTRHRRYLPRQHGRTLAAVHARAHQRVVHATARNVQACTLQKREGGGAAQGALMRSLMGSARLYACALYLQGWTGAEILKSKLFLRSYIMSSRCCACRGARGGEGGSASMCA